LKERTNDYEKNKYIRRIFVPVASYVLMAFNTDETVLTSLNTHPKK
jgi:hypothetical protein